MDLDRDDDHQLIFQIPVQQITGPNGNLGFRSHWGTSFLPITCVDCPYHVMHTYSEIEDAGTLTAHSVQVVTADTGASLARLIQGRNLWVLCPQKDSFTSATPVLSSRPAPRTDEMLATSCSSTQPTISEVLAPSLASSSKPLDSETSEVPLDEGRSTYWAPSAPCLTSLPAGTLMLPPPERSYLTFDQAEGAVKDWSLRHGYQMCASRAKARSPVLYYCHRGGLTPDKHRRHIAADQEAKPYRTGKVGCPFKLCLRREANGPGWMVTIEVPHHLGHEADRNLPLLQGARLTMSEIETIVKERAANPAITPINIRKALNLAREQAGLPHIIGQKSIRNVLSRRKAKAASLHSFTAAQESSHSHLLVRQRTDSNGHLIGLLLMPKRVIPLLPLLSDVLGIDATYKTSDTDYCLVQNVGFLPWRSGITIATAFLANEDTASYMWMLDQMIRLWPENSLPRLVITDNDSALRAAVQALLHGVPTMLCHWHASCNVDEKIAQHLPMADQDRALKDWKGLIEEEDGLASEVKWQRYVSRCEKIPGGQDFLLYLQDGWHSPERWTKIAACHTKAHRHFGYRVTSQVESQHASLKANLPRIALRRRQALTVLLDQWWSWWEARFKSAQLQLIKEKETDYWMREDRFFAHVKGRIARHALELAKEQTTAALQAATEVDPYDYRCTYDLRTNDEPLGSHDGCSIWTARGVPCSHRIQIFLHSGQQSLEVTDFASFYRLPHVIADDAQTVHPDGISTQATLRSDWAQMGAELQEHYETVGRLPGNHSQRIKCAKQAYLNGTVIDSAIWTSPKKAITATAKTHNAARRLLTKLERSKKARKAKLHWDSRRCLRGPSET